MGPATEAAYDDSPKQAINYAQKSLRSAGTQLSSAVAKEKAAIDHELGYLAGALEEAHSLIAQLEARVVPVSASQPPSDQEVPAHEYVGSSSVYDRLHNSVVAIHMLQTRIAVIVRNLEV